MTTDYVLQAVRTRTLMVPPSWIPRRVTETFLPTFCLAVVSPASGIGQGTMFTL